MGTKVVSEVISSGQLRVFSVAGMCITLVEARTSVEYDVLSIGVRLYSSC